MMENINQFGTKELEDAFAVKYKGVSSACFGDAYMRLKNRLNETLRFLSFAFYPKTRPMATA